MIIASRTQLKGSSRFQPGEGPSRGLLCDFEPSDGTFWSTSVFPDKTESLPPNNGEILSCVKTHQTSSSLYLH